MFNKDLLFGLLRMEVDREDSYHRRPLDMSRVGGGYFEKHKESKGLESAYLKKFPEG